MRVSVEVKVHASECRVALISSEGEYARCVQHIATSRCASVAADLQLVSMTHITTIVRVHVIATKSNDKTNQQLVG
jgi:hypothetical protein